MTTMIIKITFFIAAVGVILSLFGIFYGLATIDELDNDGKWALLFSKSFLLFVLGGASVIFCVKLFENIFLQ